jgi:hypothetical protein
MYVSFFKSSIYYICKMQIKQGIHSFKEEVLRQLKNRDKRESFYFIVSGSFLLL